MLYLNDRREIRLRAGLTTNDEILHESEATPSHVQLFTAIELVRLAMEFEIIPELFDGDSVSFNEIWQRGIEPRLACYDPYDPSDPDEEASVEQDTLQEDLMAILKRLAAHNVAIGVQAVGPGVWWSTYACSVIEGLTTWNPRNPHEEYAINCLLRDVSELTNDLKETFANDRDDMRLGPRPNASLRGNDLASDLN